MVKKDNKNRVSLVLSDYLYEYVVSQSELLGMPMNAFISKVIHDYKQSMLPPRVITEDELIYQSMAENYESEQDARIMGLILENKRLIEELNQVKK